MGLEQSKQKSQQFIVERAKHNRRVEHPREVSSRESETHFRKSGVRGQEVGKPSAACRGSSEPRHAWSEPRARTARVECTHKQQQIEYFNGKHSKKMAQVLLFSCPRLDQCFWCTVASSSAPKRSLSHSQHHTGETAANKPALAKGLEPDWLSGFCSRITKIF